MYARSIKRPLDLILSACALVVLSPLILVLALVGAVVMRGDPFFRQPRPGRKGPDGQERIFRLVKLRTMTDARGPDGTLLPDERRLVPYGRWLRSTSLDELPELWNVLKGDMSLVGPRPLLVSYLPWYTEEERHRHDVRPGLTGYAQIHGRNAVGWEDRFRMDLRYVDRITFLGDLGILFGTVSKVLSREGISSGTSETMESFIDYAKARGRTPQTPQDRGAV